MNITGTDSRKSSPSKSRSYSAALVLIGYLLPLPIVATIITAAIYIAPLPTSLHSLLSTWLPLNWLAVAAGCGITLVFWLLFALFFKGFTSMESANPVSGSHLKNHFYALRAGFAALNDNVASLPKERSSSYHIAHGQVECYLEEIGQILDRNDMRWIAGTGYLHAWGLMHRAEEVMIALEPREEVIREAIYDEMCLTGSTIDAGPSAIKKLELAVMNLSPWATQYLDSTDNQNTSNGPLISKDLGGPTPDGKPLVIAQDSYAVTTNGTPKVVTQDASAALSTATPAVTAQDVSNASSDKLAMLATDEKSAVTSEKPVKPIIAEMEARNAIRDARRTINEYRDHLWEGLVIERNQLMGTALITGLLTYVLLCFAILAGVSSVSIIAATAFYLVGALVGLFSRLYSESKTDSATDDYNLTLARMIVTPMLAGLAAVGGVLLTTLLSLTLIKSAVPQMPGLANPQLGLADGYNLQTNTLGLLIAAVFAMTPNLFINTLQKKAKDFTDQLQNTSASDQANSGKKP